MNLTLIQAVGLFLLGSFTTLLILAGYIWFTWKFDQARRIRKSNRLYKEMRDYDTIGALMDSLSTTPHHDQQTAALPPKQ